MSGTYKRDPFGDGKVWAILLGGALALVAVLYLLSCGGGGPSQQAARTAMYVVRALCSDSMTVGECAELLEDRAKFLDGPEKDGGSRE